MVDDADETVEILATTTPVAIKPHVCNECHREIKAGEVYLNERFKLDGKVETHKTCTHCQVVRRWLIHECDGFIFTMVSEDIWEHFREGGYGFDVGRLTVGIRKRWTRKDGSLMPVPTIRQQETAHV